MDNDNLIVEYGKTKNHYAILDDNVLMKDPSTGDWKRGVLYRQHKELNNLGEYIPISEVNVKTFVREYNEFWKKFTLCLDL